MDLTRALDQLSEIHHHLSRAEVYRGYRSQTVAATGGLALIGAWAWETWLAEAPPSTAVLYWVALAGVCLIMVSCDVLKDYPGHSPAQQRITRKAVGQFLPTLAVGGVLTLAFALESSTVGLLPGLWALVFALGVFSSRPYLPQGVGWVALFYLVAGSGLLLSWKAGFGTAWTMGCVFGVGQLALSAVLYWNLERS